MNSSPQTKAAFFSPPRAANSHSASLGSDFPDHAAYASASSYATWTTGWSSRSSTVLAGPSGCRQQALGTYAHQARWSFKLTRCGGRRKTSDPATRREGSTSGYSAGSGARSGTVTYPVASTNRRNSALVTGCRSIQKPSTVTRWTGLSSG